MNEEKDVKKDEEVVKIAKKEKKVKQKILLQKNNLLEANYYQLDHTIQCVIFFLNIL